MPWYEDVNTGRWSQRSESIAYKGGGLSYF